MRKTLKWTLPATLALAAIVGWSFQSAVAQNAAAKGKITVTVKNPEGAAAADVPVSLLKGNVPLPAGGRRGGGAEGGGAPPASQPAPLMTGTTNAQGMYTFEGVDAGEMTVMAGRGGGGRRGGGGGGAPGAGGAPPAGGNPPAAGGAPGGGGGGARGGGGRGVATGTVKAGEELKLEINLVAGRGGGGGGAGGGGGRRGAGGAPAGQ